MKLIIDISEEEYKFIKDLQFYSSGRRNGKTIEKHVINAIKNSIPYNPSGELISREALKDYARKVMNDKDALTIMHLELFDNIIDNAPTIEFPPVINMKPLTAGIGRAHV